MKATKFLSFDLNSKVIVANMSTQVTYETNQIFLPLDLAMSRELRFFIYFIVT